MTGKIGDDGDMSVTPAQAKKMYEHEYKQAADLFQRALDADAKSDNMYQKDEYRKVMEQSVQVLKETAGALKKDNLLDQANKIEQDLATYQQDHSKTSIFQLHQDLEKARKG
jgi:hypothetical protein